MFKPVQPTFHDQQTGSYETQHSCELSTFPSFVSKIISHIRLCASSSHKTLSHTSDSF